MPPWHADPNHGHFANDRSLTPAERSTLVRWIEQGTPPGELEGARSPRCPQGWSIGTPDIMYEMADPFVVPAEGTVPIQRFRVATNLKDDLWVQAAEVHPGDRAVVHQFASTSTILAPRDNRAAPHIKGLLAAYTPGEIPSVFPPGIAKRIPPGSELLFEVHYTPIGRVGSTLDDRPHHRREAPEHLAVTRGIAGWGLKIPPRTTSSRRKQRGRLIAISAYSASHRTCTFAASRSSSPRVSRPTPGNPALRAALRFQLAKRLPPGRAQGAFPKGTLIQCDAEYDNSASNPANPDPEQTVLWGEQSWDEMMIGFIDYYEDHRLPFVE